MSFLDRLFGRDDRSNEPPQQAQWRGRQAPGGRGPDPRSPDEIALERYRYLLRTAPPEQIEQAHAEAFANLTPEQRSMALQQLAQIVPESELRGASDDPRSLARLATRAELRQPGSVERALGQPRQQEQGGRGMGMGMGMPGLGSMLLYSLAGSFIGTAIASTMFANHGYPEGDPGGDAGGGEGSNVEQAGYDESGAGGDGGDYGQSSGGSWDEGGGGDMGGTADAGGFGDFGGGFGDFGGGDFGGGDFGGGDF
jgi:hypothetical protein